MYEFIRIQYALGKLTAEQVMEFAPRWITEEQAEEIVGAGSEPGPCTEPGNVG